MKKTLFILSILLICISISIYGQKNIDGKHIKLTLGIGGNSVKDKVNANSIYGKSNITVEPTFGVGYYFSSNFDIPIYKRLSLKTGINFSLYNHTTKSSYIENNNTVISNARLSFYQPAIEIPLMFSYKFLKFKDNYLSFNAGLKYTSYIYYTSGTGEWFNDYSIGISTSPDLNIGDGNSFKNMNLSSILGISFSKKLNNNDYINFNFTYNIFVMRPIIAEYRLINPAGYIIGGGKIQGYYQGISLGVSYTFSFQKSYDEIYKKGFNEGLKIN